MKKLPGRKKYTAVVKLAFPFDDPGLMDNCPFMCKIGENIGTTPETKYYGVAYTTDDQIEQLTEWGQRFPHAKLITNLEPWNSGTTDESVVRYVKKEEE